jgi:hypothetical protein
MLMSIIPQIGGTFSDIDSFTFLNTMRERYARTRKDGPMPKYLRRLFEENSFFYSGQSACDKDPSRSERARRNLSHTGPSSYDDERKE